MVAQLHTLAAMLTALGLIGPLPTIPPEPVRATVARSLPLLQKSGAEYIHHRECFSCHHQALPLLALTTARPRGFAVSEQGLENQLRHTADFLAKNRDNYQKGRGTGGQADTAGYGLLALEVGGWKPDATTAAMAEYLLLRDRNSDHWHVSSRRPPSEASSFTTTYLALRGLRRFGTPEQQERIATRTDQARRWLLASKAKDTEDRVFRLGALHLAGAEAEDIQAARQDLVRTQRKDGGWGQTDALDSDTYATGTALVMLHQAGGLPVSDPVYQRGLRFLIGAQQADGSWRVHSRSQPFQTYFESGFPHGADQFISIAASSWATAALALACPLVPEGAPVKPVRSEPEASARKEKPR
jgi:hypothetical protein